MKVRFVEMDAYGIYPKRAICPVCGKEVIVKEMASEGSAPHYRKCFNPGLVGGSNSHEGVLECGHTFKYENIDFNSLHELRYEFGYINNIVDFITSYEAKQTIAGRKLKEDVENILEEKDIKYNYPCNNRDSYKKLHNFFGDMDLREGGEDRLKSYRENDKNIVIIERWYKRMGKPITHSAYEWITKYNPFDISSTLSIEIIQTTDVNPSDEMDRKEFIALFKKTIKNVEINPIILKMINMDYPKSKLDQEINKIWEIKNE